ncbi:hypothetical protein DPMN_064141 [Dreissena polymorpha]|uniref:Uncharacterized protein n=1 Tax=Dreissena polymorpha TaxID=45954 RepID=A0A9D4HH62_DREPO|nr:hypothetical protein DPMN_061736 [Dreissena polymorpha]KAH3721222.1 hypothetical protein DPMN_064141 [Dreissena polymorpha]
MYLSIKLSIPTTLTTCFDQRAFFVSTISDQKVVDDCPCLLKEEVEERVRSLKAGKSPGVDNFFSELIKH